MQRIFSPGGDFMVMIYGIGIFDKYLAALSMVGIRAEVSTSLAMARRCRGCGRAVSLVGGADREK